MSLRIMCRFTLIPLLLFAASCTEKDSPTVERSPAEAERAEAVQTAETSSDSKVEKETQEDVAATAAEFVYFNPLSQEQRAEGWLSLFDGQSLFGWESTSEDIDWRVEDGAIVAEQGPIGFLLTKVPYADYELVCEYRMEPGGNSGLFLRCDNPPGDISTECYEINIADEHPDGFTTGSLVNRQKLDAPVERSADWNSFRIVVDGSRVSIAHNGESLIDYDAAGKVAPVGRIGLQKNAGKIEFRQVLVRPLNLQSLFHGEDLSGWRQVPGSKSEFTVEDGAIHVKNGPGFLETEQTYTNFLFQSQVFSHAQELNSGFFFRAMPGTEEAPSNGYEYQIHNGFEGDDRSRPSNAGTGAIFRRVDARYVVANDQEWFTATLIANGPRIACFVDGYQVVDWEDTRKPDPNPRRGLRLEGGHLSLQGHDPTTDLSFRNLRIAEFPEAAAANE